MTGAPDDQKLHELIMFTLICWIDGGNVLSDEVSRASGYSPSNVCAILRKIQGIEGVTGSTADRGFHFTDYFEPPSDWISRLDARDMAELNYAAAQTERR